MAGHFGIDDFTKKKKKGKRETSKEEEAEGGWGGRNRKKWLRSQPHNPVRAQVVG